MSSGSRPGPGVPASGSDGSATDRPRPTADAEVRWHRSRAGDQVVLGVEAGGVRLAVAFPADASRADVVAALDERDRELRHFFDTGGDGGDR